VPVTIDNLTVAAYQTFLADRHGGIGVDAGSVDSGFCPNPNRSTLTIRDQLHGAMHIHVITLISGIERCASAYINRSPIARIDNGHALDDYPLRNGESSNEQQPRSEVRAVNVS